MKSDGVIDDGSVMYKLVLRALPQHFSPDSIYAHMPLVLPSMNESIMEKLARRPRYSYVRPRFREPRMKLTHPVATRALQDNDAFDDAPWKDQLILLMGQPGQHIGPFGESKDFERRRMRLERSLYKEALRPAYETLFEESTGLVYDHAQSFRESCKTFQIDIVRDFANLGS